MLISTVPSGRAICVVPVTSSKDAASPSSVKTVTDMPLWSAKELPVRSIASPAAIYLSTFECLNLPLTWA